MPRTAAQRSRGGQWHAIKSSLTEVTRVSLLRADPLALPGCGDPVADRRRGHLAPWRSPQGQPPWARPALLGIAAVAALLYARNIAEAGLAPFYSVAVKSMSVSWKAFFYGAFDPKATITIDKLAGSFLPQALSARDLRLPSLVAGLAAGGRGRRDRAGHVPGGAALGRAWPPGLLAAGIFAITPIAASMFGHSMEDGALTMCLVLAADAGSAPSWRAGCARCAGRGSGSGSGSRPRCCRPG